MAAALLWSTGGLAIKLAPLDAYGVVFWRSAIAIGLTLAVFRPPFRRLRRASLGSAAVYAGMIVTFVVATKLTTAANAIFLQYTGPLYVLVLAPLLLDERFRRADGVAVSVALLGMCLFFVGRLERGALAGNLVAVVSGVFFALTVLLLRRDQNRAAAAGRPDDAPDAMASVLVGNLIAVLVTLPLAARSLPADGRTVALVLYLGVFQLGLAYILFVRGLAAVPAAEASLLGMLEPFFNPLWAFLGLGERPSGWAIGGGAIVLLAVAGRTVWASRERA